MPVERLDQSASADKFQIALHRMRYDLALEHVRGARAVLEIGTGCGELSVALSQMSCAYAGVEIDAGAAAQTRARIGKPVRIEEVDARRLPFSNGEFSHVICMEVLEHLGDYRPAIGEIQRCLQSDGKAVISVPHRTHGGKNPGNPFHLYEPGEQELTDAFRESFSEVEVLYQYFEETWLMTFARRFHLRKVLGMAKYYQGLVEGDPVQLQRLRIGPKRSGMITNLLLIARNPRSQPGA